MKVIGIEARMLVAMRAACPETKRAARAVLDLPRRFSAEPVDADNFSSRLLRAPMRDDNKSSPWDDTSTTD